MLMNYQGPENSCRCAHGRFGYYFYSAAISEGIRRDWATVSKDPLSLSLSCTTCWVAVVRDSSYERLWGRGAC